MHFLHFLVFRFKDTGAEGDPTTEQRCIFSATLTICIFWVPNLPPARRLGVLDKTERRLWI